MLGCFRDLMGEPEDELWNSDTFHNVSSFVTKLDNATTPESAAEIFDFLVAQFATNKGTRCRRW